MPRASQVLKTSVIGIAASLTTGCSTLVDLAGVPHAGLQPDGRYVVSADERALDCRRLSVLVYRQIEQMQRMPERAAVERDALPPTVTAAFSRAFGEPGSGIKTVGDYQRSRTRATALNQLLAEKSCPTIDLDAPLSESDLMMSAVRGS